VKNLIAAIAVCLILAGCLGYHVGPVKPSVLRDVHVISVPTFENKTLLPRVEVLITDTVIKQLQQDGTYKIAETNNADAVLKAEITEINRTPARSVRGNVLATTEFNLTMHVRYRLETQSGKVLMPIAEVVGTTSFFVGTDVITDERQALPLAAEELANHFVTQLSEGW
jgi:outer membrane lipopolysaccharide assembly protein LptE/RlpB